MKKHRKPRPDDLVATMPINEAIQLKINEVRACASVKIESIKRRNMNTILEYMNPEQFREYWDNLVIQARSDPKVACFLLQYFAGKPSELNTGPHTEMEELRALIAASMVSQVPPGSSEE